MEITRIRLLPPAANDALEQFVFAGHYGTMRPPRGIAPAQVSEFVKRRVVPGADADELAKTLELVRYYERKDVVEPFLGLLAAAPATPGEFERQAVICQMAGDLGERPEMEKAVQHLEGKMVPAPLAVKYVPQLLAAYLALAPAGTLAVLENRLKTEQARLLPKPPGTEEEVRAYQQITSALNNDLERTRPLLAAKARYASMPPDEARPRLIKLYLGMEGPPDPYLQVWAARRVRQEALAGNPDPAQAEFRRVLDSFVKDKVKDDPALQARYWRAEHACRYFGGLLNDAIRDVGTAAKARTLDFLDDDD